MVADSARAVLCGARTDKCSVSEYREQRLPDGSSALREETVYEDIPCRLSFLTNRPAVSDGSASSAEGRAVLFTAPEIDIRPGSKVTVTRAGQSFTYMSSGAPAVYASHREIALTLSGGYC